MSHVWRCRRVKNGVKCGTLNLRKVGAEQVQSGENQTGRRRANAPAPGHQELDLMPSENVALCECGCGQPSPLAKVTMRARGYVKGQPQRFVLGHQKRPSLRESFEAKVDRSPGQGPNGDCHMWTAARFGDKGYGAACAPGNPSGTRTIGAHRVAWFLATGQWADPLHVLHHCDNRACVRPEHLFLGTHQDNVRDMVSKRRHVHGETHPGAKLTRAEVAEIRALVGHERPVDTALRFGVTQQAIHQIQTGKHWTL